MSQPPPTQTPRVRKATRRMGARELMRIQWVVVTLICVLLFFAFRPYFTGLIERRDFITCQDNVRKISRGITTYASDYDGTLPLAANWMDKSLGFMKATSGTGFKDDDVFRCPHDKSGAPSSYAYNTILEGLSPSLSIQSSDPKLEARRKAAGRIERAPLIIEKHGSPRNASLLLNNWEDVKAQLQLPHKLPDPTGNVLLGNGSVVSRTAESLENAQGKRF